MCKQKQSSRQPSNSRRKALPKAISSVKLCCPKRHYAPCSNSLNFLVLISCVKHKLGKWGIMKPGISYQKDRVADEEKDSLTSLMPEMAG